MKWKIDKMANWQNGKLTKWYVDVIPSWSNAKLTKYQVEEIESFQNVKMKWNFVKLMKQQDDEMGKLTKFAFCAKASW